MYKKAIGGLLLVQVLMMVGCCCMMLWNMGQQENVKSIYEIELDEILMIHKKNSIIEINMQTRSDQRVVTYQVLQRPGQDKAAWFTVEDYTNLLRIVEAEASGEDETGKLLVANVVLNRVKDDGFPDTITEVIFQKNKGITQFSPISNGRFWQVQISEETITAVDRALAGEDLSNGALYFASRKYADADNMRWFDEKLEYLFAHGGHEFFKE